MKSIFSLIIFLSFTTANAQLLDELWIKLDTNQQEQAKERLAKSLWGSNSTTSKDCEITILTPDGYKDARGNLKYEFVYKITEMFRLNSDKDEIYMIQYKENIRETRFERKEIKRKTIFSFFPNTNELEEVNSDTTVMKVIETPDGASGELIAQTTYYCYSK